MLELIYSSQEVEVTVLFRPREPMTYTRTVYCDITGRETRLPLKLRGDAAGPTAAFAFDSIELGAVFINTTHVYSVEVTNTGEVDAPFTVQPPETIFGPAFSVSPASGTIPVGQSVQLEVGGCVFVCGCDCCCCDVWVWV